jgi:hypothetical protein
MNRIETPKALILRYFSALGAGCRRFKSCHPDLFAIAAACPYQDLLAIAAQRVQIFRNRE